MARFSLQQNMQTFARPYYLELFLAQGGGGGGGGGGYSTNVYTSPTPYLYPCRYHFFNEKGTPFVYLLMTNGTPFTYLV